MPIAENVNDVGKVNTYNHVNVKTPIRASSSMYVALCRDTGVERMQIVLAPLLIPHCVYMLWQP